jgi:cation transporter-like permease
MNHWWAYARARSTVRRALASAVVVGPILVVINHADAIVHGDVTGSRMLKMLLTFAVPYAVSTYSSVQAELEHRHSPPSHLG